VVEAYSARFPTLPQMFWASTSAACLSESRFDDVRIFTLCPLKSTVAGGVQAEIEKPMTAKAVVFLNICKAFPVYNITL